MPNVRSDILMARKIPALLGNQNETNAGFSPRSSQGEFPGIRRSDVAHLDEDRGRFSRIEPDLALIKVFCIKHEEIFQKLADSVKDRIQSLTAGALCNAQRGHKRCE